MNNLHILNGMLYSLVGNCPHVNKQRLFWAIAELEASGMLSQIKQFKT